MANTGDTVVFRNNDATMHHIVLDDGSAELGDVRAGSPGGGLPQDKALDAYSKALQLVRDDREALRGLLETHIARGTADEAAEVLERVVEGREDDKELVSMLARAYLEAEDPKGAERATSMLIWQGATAHGAPDPLRPNTSSTVAFLDIGILVFREGLECILVLAAITASMTAARVSEAPFHTMIGTK